jgi:AcrR family transcriptional regulator
VLYRRWPSRAALVRDAMRQHVGPFTGDPPDTGDLREDILSVLRRYRHIYREIGPDITHGLMSELADVPPDVYEVVPAVVTAVLRRAALRGDVRLREVTPRIAALPGDLLRFELMLPHGDASDAALAEIVDDIFLPLVLA